jgi:hypothetical protein
MAARVLKTECSRGHPLSGDNVYYIPSTGRRACRTCKREVWNRTEREKRRARLNLPPPSPYVGRYAIKPEAAE